MSTRPRAPDGAQPRTHPQGANMTIRWLEILGADPACSPVAFTPFSAYCELLRRLCAVWAFQLLHLTLARLRWSVASGRRVCRS